MDQQVADVSVLAGNSRVHLDENLSIVIEAQLKAFDAALRFARQRLSHLAPSIQQVFLPIAEKHGISLSDIRAIHEDSARQHLVHTLAAGDIPQMLKRRMVTDTPADEKSLPGDARHPA